MKKFFRNLSVFTLIAAVGLGACKDDDSDSCDNGTFAMTLNADDYAGKDFDNTLVIGESAGFDGKRMDIRATDSQGRQLIITFTDMTSGKEGNGVTTEDVYIPMSDIGSQTDSYFFFTLIDGDVSYPFIDGTLDITSCDASKKQVSGTFTFYDGENEANGSFTNMCYRIIKQ
jgi:hypothetical protein